MSPLLLYPPPSNVILRTRWYVHIRWFLLAAVAVPGILSLYIGEGWSNQVQRDTLLAAVAIGSNGIFFALSRILKGETAFRILACLLIAVDILIITYLIFTKGGVESRSPILYVIPILMSAAIFGRKAIYRSALTGILLYDGLIIADYLNIIQSIGAVNPQLRSELPYVMNTVAFFTSVLLIIAVSTDFITRLLIEKEREASESLEDLKRVQAIAQFGSWEWNVLTNKVLWSDELYRIFGVNLNQEITENSFMSIVHPQDRKNITKSIQAIKAKQKPMKLDYRIIRPDGNIRYVHGEGQPVVDNNGHLVKVFGTVQDITEAKLLDEAKSEFVSLASHQLRTPATAVKQYVGMLLEGYAGEMKDERQYRFLRTAYDSNERQLGIINDLLNVAQIDAKKLKLNLSTVDLVSLLRDVIAEQQGKFAGKDQTISFRPRYKHLYCQADAQRLRMALENIIDNAHKYTLSGKKVAVRLERKPKSVTIRISDQGVGIAKKDIHKVFNKFARIEHPATTHEEGSGIGLYWAHRVVSLHGGKIAIESKLDKGTTFIITLPKGRV